MDAESAELLHVTVDLWHPDCWTLQTTRQVDVGLVGYRTMRNDTGATGQFGVYGESQDVVDGAIEAIQASSFTEAATRLSPAAALTGSVGPTTCPVLVEFDPEPSIRSAFTARGFFHHSPTRHERGRERRSLITRGDRSTLQRALTEIETAYDADIEVIRVTSATEDRSNHRPTERLSPRQQEAFQLARARGYYEYPRETTSRDLAAELDVSKTTFLEHLRKAEAKLLTDIDL
ncbi:helix-turn-helix domain-containing protein [Haloarcula nitratireducens]|uniref:Helix-turn-helix domain-containing protein n=1 Tax=Haloarcula nitratireducens TaxID=2487749 RepID=A0AAW4PFW7_9EURY|nr:helix-turn-helix domain-containing protein [Halomicroarcula nitratireducens]MBX0296776.1 helix-turn-helix domain-containing protein [Halomicroarcula nitratireducens]